MFQCAIYWLPSTFFHTISFQFVSLITKKHKIPYCLALNRYAVHKQSFCFEFCKKITFVLATVTVIFTPLCIGFINVFCLAVFIRLCQTFKEKIFPNGNVATESKSRTVKNWERGNCEPDIKTIKKICTVLKCSSDYLLSLDNRTTKNTPFIHDKTGLSDKAIKILMHRNEIGGSPGSSYTWTRNSIKVINDLIEQKIYLSEDVPNPIANYIYYPSIFESPSYTRHERNTALDKFRLSLFTATNGLTDCIKAIYKNTKKIPDTN